MSKLIGTITTLVLFLGATVYSSASGEPEDIIVYGQNTSAWNEKLGVTATRTSCSLEAPACISQSEKLLAAQNTRRLYLNLPVDAAKIAAFASYYSKASLSEPRLYELAVDDFPDHFNIWCLTKGIRCEDLMNQVIDNTKASNPKLKFGVTIYEDQIASMLANARFKADLRRRIDTVHLYIHTRAHGPQFEMYLKQIKQGFPNAQVIAGSYPFDRLDYEGCHACSAPEARDLQKQTLAIQARLLRQGAIVGIEIYPGFFGLEDKWPSWDNPRMCAPERKQECIDNTKAMRDDALVILRGAEAK